MGLTTFSGELPALKDIGIAKNYLNESELKILNNLVSGYFDLAEISAIEHKPMYMSDYIQQLDAVLTSGNRPLLNSFIAGKTISEIHRSKKTGALTIQIRRGAEIIALVLGSRHDTLLIGITTR